MGSPCLKVIFDQGPRKGQILECLPGRNMRIGRIVRGNTISVKDPGISQNHLRIEFNGENWTISDLNSSNGTLVNDNMIPPLQQFKVSDGDIVKIGEVTVLVVEIEKMVGEGFDATVDKNSSQVSTRRSCAKKDVVSVADVSKVPSEKNEQVDGEVGVLESQKIRRLPPRVATRGTISSQVGLPLVSETYEDPKILTNQFLAVIDAKKTKELGLSECQVKADLPPLPAAKKPIRKKKTETNTELQVTHSNSIDEHAEVNCSRNQPRRNMPRRAATKRKMTEKSQDVVSEVYGDPEELADANVVSSVKQNNEPAALPEELPWRCLPQRGAAKRSSAKNDPEELADANVVSSVKQNNESAALPEELPWRCLPRRGAAKRTSAKNDQSLVADTDVEDSEGLVLECQIKGDLPLPDAKRHSRKMKTETNTETQDILEPTLSSTDEPLHLEVNFSRNQRRRNMPRRAATKRYKTEKNQDGLSEVFDDPKELADANVVPSVQRNNESLSLLEEMPWHRLPQRGAAKRSSVKKDQSLVFGISGSLLNASEKISELNDNIVDHEKLEIECKLQENAALVKNANIKMNASTSKLVSPSANEVLPDILPQQSCRRKGMPENDALSFIDGPKIQNANRKSKKSGKKTRRGAKDSAMEHEEVLILSEKNEVPELKNEVADALTCRMQHKMVSDINHVKEGEESQKGIREMTDLENITLGDWFDRMEKHLPMKFDAVADEIIGKLRQRHEQFQQFVMAYYNK